MQEILDRSHVLMQCYLIHSGTKESPQPDSEDQSKKSKESTLHGSEDQSKQLKEFEESIRKKREELKRHIDSIKQ